MYTPCRCLCYQLKNRIKLHSIAEVCQSLNSLQKYVMLVRTARRMPHVSLGWREDILIFYHLPRQTVQTLGICMGRNPILVQILHPVFSYWRQSRYRKERFHTAFLRLLLDGVHSGQVKKHTIRNEKKQRFPLGNTKNPQHII